MMSTSKNVYIVDDDQAVRESLQWLLESVGLHTKTFDSAQRLLAEVGGELAHTAGCLIVDVGLPRVSGLTLQRHLADLGVRMPVIVITGYGQVSEAVAAMKAGAVDYIEKPFTQGTLIERVQRVLQGYAPVSKSCSDTHRSAASLAGEHLPPLGEIEPRTLPNTTADNR